MDKKFDRDLTYGRSFWGKRQTSSSILYFKLFYLFSKHRAIKEGFRSNDVTKHVTSATIFCEQLWIWNHLPSRFHTYIELFRSFWLYMWPSFAFLIAFYISLMTSQITWLLCRIFLGPPRIWNLCCRFHRNPQ
jgi:hypothetical protein